MNQFLYPVKLTDLFLNTILPILIGACLYLGKPFLLELSIVKNQVADGLWAYAFASAILIVWDRNLNYAWLFTCFVSCLLFEWLQHLAFINGTADIYDIIAYVVGFVLAILFNNFYKNKFQPKLSS